jgi:hypothetical protein
MMAGITRRPAFWIVYAAVALTCLALAWRLFPLAIPLVNLDIKLARHDAVARALEIAKERNLVAFEPRTAARFRNDQNAQNYIELEGGGKPVFAQMVEGNVYAPYWWEVRLFKPGVVEEANIRFRPDGTPNGFSRRLPETYVRDAATSALDPAAALALARTRAQDDWNVDFGPYHLLEQSQETQTSGRVDHQFVFERDERFAGASVRLRLTVAGDELTGIAPFVQVPEKFERRFQELRSANNTIANFASLAAVALYGLGGCIIAVLWLLRERWLLWRPALAAGVVVGGLMALTVLAGAPAAWFGFDTAETVAQFWVQQISAALLALVAGALAYGLIFMAAESLSRRAFPGHPQLWRLWARDAGGTTQVLGRTAGGYLFVPLELALISAFYLVTNQWLGWWQPSESLTDPNVLSSAVPALAPIAMSLQAGFMEECAFRAIPLSLAALLGARFGQRAHWIVFAVALQAMIFAGAHANYPGLPAYSRLVELLLPATLWALIFLRFGLLPTILLHALFDLSLFSIPLFLVDAPGAGMQRALVIAAAAVPLAVVGLRRWQAGGWRELPAGLWNRAWQPAAAALAATVGAARAASIGARVAMLQRALPWLGLAGFVAWLAFTTFSADVPALRVDRKGAEAAAVAELARRGVVLPPEWRRFSGIRSGGETGQSLAQRFVWREAGADAYRALVGNTLAPPLWEVRFVRFDGDVVARTEEWRVSVVGDGAIRQVRHRLPESAPGATLDRDAALALAQRVVREQFGRDPAALQLRSAEQAKRDARSDWTIVFADPKVVVGKDGEARIQVVLAGDEIISAGRSVFVPEAWQRAETERDNRLQVLQYAASFAVALGALAALVFAVISWNRGHCDRRALLAVGALTFGGGVIDLANAWPEAALQLRTAEPVASQLALGIAGGSFVALLGAGLMALLAGVGAWYARTSTPARLATRLPAWAVGVAVALAVAGLAAAFGALAPRAEPLWPALKMATQAWPVVAAMTDPIGLAGASGVALFVLFLLERGTRGWTMRPWIAALLLVLISCVAVLVSGGEPEAAALRGVVKGLVSFALLWWVLRYDLTTIPAFLATGTLLDAARNAALEATDGAWTLFAVGAVVTVAVTWAATRYIAKPLPTGP